MTDRPSVGYVLRLCPSKTNPAWLVGVIAVGLIVLRCSLVGCRASANCATGARLDAEDCFAATLQNRSTPRARRIFSIAVGIKSVFVTKS